MADQNLIKSADVTVKVRDIEFIKMFNDNISRLQTALGLFRRIARDPGTNLKAYKTTGTLEDGSGIGEGELIPLSKYKREVADVAELSFNKWRKETSYEAIQSAGYNEAIAETDAKMIQDIQKAIRTQIYEFLKTGTGTASGDNLQKAIANTWGALNVAFEDTSATPVYFVHPLDIATYLGGAQITTQTAFGFSYVENFLGMGRVIIDSNIDQGTLIATASENLNLYYAPASTQGFDFTTDETGLIGVHHDVEYSNLTTDTVAVSALTLFPEYLDRIFVTTIGEDVPSA